MLLSSKRDYNLRMQVADSVRYREAVSRLKRILYDKPSSFEIPKRKSPLLERTIYGEQIADQENNEKEVIDNALDGGQKSLGSLFDMVRKQEDLIAQLEKENFFLKNELVSTAEASKEVALQNETFRKRLTETLIQMETSPDISLFSEGKEKMEEVITTLKEEREKLVEYIKLQEDTISSLRRTEMEAIDKVKQAVNLAEEGQRLTDQVRESSEKSRKDLQSQLEDTLNKLRYFQMQLHKAQEKEKEQEILLRNQETNLSRLEEDRRDKDLSLRRRELDYQNQIEDLKRNLKETEEGKQRAEKLLREQRKTSEATFKRLEALLDRRNLEAEAFANKRKFFEQQIWDLKHENEKLLRAINDLAKERSANTDDAKYAKQISNLLPQDINETQMEIKEIKSTVQQHQESILHLQEEVSAVRQEMTQGIEGLRDNFEDLNSSMNKGRSEVLRERIDLPRSRDTVTSNPDVNMAAEFSEGRTITTKPDDNRENSPNSETDDQKEEQDESCKIISFPHKIKDKGLIKEEVDSKRKELYESEGGSSLSNRLDNQQERLSNGKAVKNQKIGDADRPAAGDRPCAEADVDPLNTIDELSIPKSGEPRPEEEVGTVKMDVGISLKEIKTHSNDEKDTDDCSIEEESQSVVQSSDQDLHITPVSLIQDPEEEDVDISLSRQDFKKVSLATDDQPRDESSLVKDFQGISNMGIEKIGDNLIPKSKDETKHKQEEIEVQSTVRENRAESSQNDAQVACHEEVGDSDRIHDDSPAKQDSKETNEDISSFKISPDTFVPGDSKVCVGKEGIEINGDNMKKMTTHKPDQGKASASTDVISESSERNDVEVTSKEERIEPPRKEESRCSEVVLPISEAIVEEISSEMEEIKKDMELQYTRINSVARKVMSFPEIETVEFPDEGGELVVEEEEAKEEVKN